MKLTRTLAAIAMALPLALASTTAVATAAPLATDTNSGSYVDLDDKCFTLQEVLPGGRDNGKYVTKGTNKYPVASNAANAEPIRFEAAFLGRYRLLDRNGKHLFASVVDTVMPGDSYGNRADWMVTPQGDTFKIQATYSKRHLGSTLGRLAVGNLNHFQRTTFRLIPASGCYVPPEGQINMLRTPSASPINADGTVNGIIDAHGHTLSAFVFGGSLICGKPFSPGGIEHALAPCESHKTGAGTFFEMLLSGTKMYEDTKMWPTFENRPTTHTLLTQTGYYTGIERAFYAGVRAMNIVFVGNRVICEIYPIKGGPCNEMEQVRIQAQQLKYMIDHIDAQAGGPGKGFMQVARTPQEMRDIIARGQMAVTIGVEVSEPFDCSGLKGCSKEKIVNGLNELQDMGVSNVFAVHKFDNPLAGTRFDAEATGIIMTFGNVISAGHFFNVEKCDGPAADIPLAMTADKLLDTYKKVFGKEYTGKLPIYPSGQICNRHGLTELGEFFVNEAMKRGMIINVDHMSVKSIKRTLEITGAAGYPGTTSAHTWSDPFFYEEILKQGGFYASYLFDTKSMVQRWKDDHKAAPSLDHYGIGPDITGLGPLADAREDADTNPLKYPFTAPTGAVFERNTMGERVWDFNKDGMATYGLLADWIADFIQQAGPDGPQVEKELMSSAEAWLQTWEGAQKWAADHK